MTGLTGRTHLEHKPVKVFKYQDLYGIAWEIHDVVDVVYSSNVRVAYLVGYGLVTK